MDDFTVFDNETDETEVVETGTCAICGATLFRSYPISDVDVVERDYTVLTAARAVVDGRIILFIQGLCNSCRARYDEVFVENRIECPSCGISMRLIGETIEETKAAFRNMGWTDIHITAGISSTPRADQGVAVGVHSVGFCPQCSNEGWE